MHDLTKRLPLNTAEPATPFGHWDEEEGLDCFVYTADHRTLDAALWDPVNLPKTRRHEVGIGNERLQMFCDNTGGVALWDEGEVHRWLTAPAPHGTGGTVVTHNDTPMGTLEADWPEGVVPERIFGPNTFRVRFSKNGVSIERAVMVPHGDTPWVLVRVTVRNDGAAPAEMTLRESWRVSPRLTPALTPHDLTVAAAQSLLRFSVEETSRSLRATQDLPSQEEIEAFVREIAETAREIDMESVTPESLRAHMTEHPPLYGDRMVLTLEPLSEGYILSSDGAAHPTLSAEGELTLAPGEERTVWFRFGVPDGETPTDPGRLWRESIEALQARLPRVTLPGGEVLSRELRWHAALLTGQASVARAGGMPGHFLSQGSLYRAFGGVNAMNDTTQFGLPLIYTQPTLARSILLNTLAWADPSGRIWYGISADGALWDGPTEFMHAEEIVLTDTALWLFWYVSEYAIATGDWAVFEEVVPYHRSLNAEPAPVREHLRRIWGYWRDTIGIGPGGNVRLRSGDWNDVILRLLDFPPERVFEEGESVYSSALAAWTLPVFAGVLERIGETALAARMRGTADELLTAVRNAWNGTWFRRAYGPEGAVIGDKAIWLEVQVWALMAGAATDEQARILIDTIKEHCMAGAPLGPRVRVALHGEDDNGGFRPGTGLAGGTWNSVNGILLWAVRDRDPELAWELWQQLSLANHIAHYPDQWSGTLSATDSYNSPESYNPGGAYVIDGTTFSAQTYPVNNAHAHTHLLLGLIRLLGIEPGTEGQLKVRGIEGVSWRSRGLEMRPDGSGAVKAVGPVAVELPNGRRMSGDGTVTWNAGETADRETS